MKSIDLLNIIEIWEASTGVLLKQLTEHESTARAGILKYYLKHPAKCHWHLR